MPLYDRSWFKMRAIFAKIYLSTEKRLSLDAHQVARHFNLSSHSTHNIAIYGLSPHQVNIKRCKNLEQNFNFQLGTLNPCGIEGRFSFN